MRTSFTLIHGSPMFGPLLRRFGVLAYVAVLGAGAAAVMMKPAPLAAQVSCYLVVCSGKVCVFEPITCPAQ